MSSQAPPETARRGALPGPLNVRSAGFALLFAAVLALGVYAAHFGSPTITWRDIDAHYAELGGPDESRTAYSAEFCGAMANSLRLNANAYTRHPTISAGRASRIPLADEYARHCEAP